MTRFMLSFLGGIEIRLDGLLITGIKTDKVQALLVYLVLERNRPHRRQSLAGLLWPDFPETRARTNLRHALANLRKSLGDLENDPAFILVEGDTLQFNSESDFKLDVVEFEALIESSREITSVDNEILDKLQGAVDLYHGPFLEGFSLKDVPEFDNWAMITRERYQVMVSDALSKLVGDYENKNEFENAILYARRWLELEPWEEEAHRQLMALLAMDGQRAAALAQYETCRIRIRC